MELLESIAQRVSEFTGTGKGKRARTGVQAYGFVTKVKIEDPEDFLQLMQWQSAYVTGSPVAVYFTAPQRQDPLIEPVAFSDALLSKCWAEGAVRFSKAMDLNVEMEIKQTTQTLEGLLY
jgi:hypothetical protein